MAKQKTEEKSFERQLKVKDLLYTHEEYDKNIGEWTFLMAVYDGVREIIRLKLIEKHEREPSIGYANRIKRLFSYNYTQSVIEIFHFFLFKKDPQSERKLGKLLEDKLWQLFVKDADLYRNDFDSVISEIDLYASVQGHMGILVDKANINVITKDEQIKKKIYPYIAKYHPQAILDWSWERDEYNRPYLSYLKLEDDNRQYRIWTQEKWEIWEPPRDKEGKYDTSNQDADAVFIDSGKNPIGIIPFLWFYNQKTKTKGIGKSDVHEITRIDLSIVRNLSQIEEIIDFAAFPMMRKPMRDAKPTEINAPQQEDEVSVESVLEFDPEKPESKPDWLKSEVSEPVKATLEVIKDKIAEIYRSANVGGMAATEPTKSPQSGVAKRIDFQLLNSKMVSKANNLEDAENMILEYWLKWEKLWDKYKDEVKMGRSRSYDIEDLSTVLEDALTAKTVVISKTFNILLQKQTARSFLPTATEKQFADIDNEIEENVNKEVTSYGNIDEDIDNPNKTDEDKKIINQGTKKIEVNNNQQTLEEDGQNQNEGGE